MQKTNTTRLYQFDYLKAVSILMVIVLHMPFTQSNVSNPIFTYFINLAVPFFMITSGYMQSLSCENRKIFKINQWFKLNNIIPKLSSIITPFVYAYLIEALIYLKLGKTSLLFYVKNFLLGGWGPGSYYPVVLIQFIILFPFIYFFIIKHPKIAFISLLALDICYELCIQYFCVDVLQYRLIFFRYIMYVASGIYLFKFKEKIYEYKIVIQLLSVISLLFLTATVYTEFNPIIFKYWTLTSTPVIAWAFEIVFIFIETVPKLPNKVHNVIAEIGNSSYYIFLVQMVWFNFYNNLNDFFPKKNFVVTAIVCVYIGIVFKNAKKKIRYLWLK